MSDHHEEILNYWDASIYEQQETYHHDVDLLLFLLPKTPQRILDVACGAGRMTLPLAKAGHLVHGFDVSTHMLSRLQAHLATGQYPTASAVLADGMTTDWGKDYDVVLLGANLLVNLITAGEDYTAAQRLFIRKAADALRPCGHLFLAFDCVDWPDTKFEDGTPWVCFDGTDDAGTYGKYIVGRESFDSVTRICIGERIWELTTKDGETFSVTHTSTKHFPTWETVKAWLNECSLTVERVWCDGEPAADGRPGTEIMAWVRKTTA